jgi:hypothetical protein
MIDNRGNLTALKDRLKETGIPESEIQDWKRRSKRTKQTKRHPRGSTLERVSGNGWVIQAFHQTSNFFWGPCHPGATGYNLNAARRARQAAGRLAPAEVRPSERWLPDT